jgi:hypothetical protein
MKDNNMKRKIIRDRQFPGSEKIASYQRPEIMQQGQVLLKKLMIKKLIYWGAGAIGVAGLATAVIMALKPNPDNVNKTEMAVQMKDAAKDSTTVVSPPIPSADKGFISYRISVKDGATICYADGSVIDIPANAFVAAGDSVTIKYREFRNVCDIFLSGIPMNYDSAGVQNTFVSGGMFELRAYDGDRELELKKDKEILVAMDVKDQGDFNEYALDEKDGAWKYTGKPLLYEPARSDQSKNEQKQKPAQALNIEAADPKKKVFDIEFSEQDFPELKGYEGIRFEVVDPSFNPKFYRLEWDAITLKKSAEAGLFRVLLSRADTTITVLAKPVLTGTGKTKEQLTAAVEQMEKEDDSKQASRQAELNSILKEVYADRREFFRSLEVVGRQSRILNVQRVGYHNLDYPIPPIPRPIFVMFESGTPEKPFVYSRIYVAKRGLNAVFSALRNQPLQVLPGDNLLIWTVDSREQIAFVKAADLRRLKAGAMLELKPEIMDREAGLKKIREFSGS